MSKIQLVVFDIAGTTVRDNGQVAEAFMRAFHEAGVAVGEAEVKKVMGFRKMDAVRLLLDRYATGSGEALAETIHEGFIQHMIAFYENDPHLAPQPHAEELFIQLHEMGIKIALNTGFTRAITDTILHRLYWDKGTGNWDNGADFIDRVICSDEVPQGRPHPDMIRSLMEALHIPSSENVLKVGDTEVDIAEGRNANCGVVVSVTTGAYTRAQLEQYSPDYIIDDLQELIPIIEKA